MLDGYYGIIRGDGGISPEITASIHYKKIFRLCSTRKSPCRGAIHYTLWES